MRQKSKLVLRAALGLGALAGATVAITACSDQPPDETEQNTTSQAAEEQPSIGKVSDLPFVDATKNPQLLAELLEKPTALGETTALQIKLPPPANPDLEKSLVRVVGETASPHLLFRSDALVQLGALKYSPGKEFFTAFVTLAPSELERIAKGQAEIKDGKFGEVTNESLVFSGRTAVGRTINPPIDPGIFNPGTPVPVNRCLFRPASTQKAWDQSLFIRAPQVVLDGARTWDPCTGAGTKGGVWTFAHLMREMANGSGTTPEVFVLNWLSTWLNNQTINGDVVPSRTQMFNQVIRPWATASGVTATLVTVGGVRTVQLTGGAGKLDLDIAPFRLEAIVNRIDLGETSTGGGGRYGSTAGQPVTSGELRFIFGVVQPSPWGAGSEATCGRKLFTTIFEYGVPGTGCNSVVSWAQKWTQLQAMSGFTSTYLTQLQAMTESVVKHGAAPGKGNQNAINQIRTNEIELGIPINKPWELREFALTIEDPSTESESPANGQLRPHTIAQSPNDDVFKPTPANATITSYVTGPVNTGLVGTTLLPTQCDAAYTVPFVNGSASFRGGNALVGSAFGGGFNFWRATLPAPVSDANKCARHTFSLNTCTGCHKSDSGTAGGISTDFVHIDPQSSIPVTMSKFLTGGGPGFILNVPDTQFGTPVWQFADLHRRLQRLFDLSHCTSCITFFPSLPVLIDRMRDIGPLPIDVDPKQFPELQVGPITDIDAVAKLLDIRVQSVDKTPRSEPVDFLRPAQTMSH